MKLLRSAIAVSALLALTLTACTTSKPAQNENKPEAAAVKKGPNGEKYGGTYHVAISSEPPLVDPQVDTSLQVYNMSRNIFSTLLRYKGDTLELEPELLAEMPKASADGKTYSFKLKDGIAFSNGAKLTAKDVKFTFERMLLPATKAANGWLLSQIVGAKDVTGGKATELAGLKVTGDLTFEITLADPYTPFLQSLANPGLSIFPAEYATQKGDKFGREPIGTGPFILKVWKQNDQLVLEKNPNYYEKGLPYLDKIEYRIIADSATSWLEFQSGNTEEGAPPTSEEKATRESGKYQVNDIVSLNTYYLALDTKTYSNPKLREAISLAIDRQAIVNAVYNGKGKVATSFVTPGIPGALKNGAGFPFDAAKAKQIIKDNKLEGTKIEVWQRGGDKVTDANLAIQQMLQDVGLVYDVQIKDKATFNAARGKGQIPAQQGNWFADFPDPDNYLYTFLFSKESVKMSVNYANADVDAKLTEARTSTDKAKREAIYQEVEKKLLYEEYAILPLYHITSTDYLQKWVKGYPKDQLRVGGMKGVWLDK
ncbi:MAG TPA: ABC transporter substrate-binding protein [Symbiobacteriaceae bacterium]|nr:ABC transporter substrate-binding protein [Symbiobacteriaceae bacterium]